jgi:hypothetical protein
MPEAGGGVYILCVINVNALFIKITVLYVVWPWKAMELKSLGKDRVSRVTS